MPRIARTSISQKRCLKNFTLKEKTKMAEPKKALSKKSPSKPEASNVTFSKPEVDEKAVAKQSTEISARITALVVKDQDSYNVAAVELSSVKQFIKYLEGIFEPAKKALNLAVKNLRDEEKKLIGPRLAMAENLERTIKKKMSDFLLAEEQRIARERREAQEKADREAEAERKKLEKKAAKAEEKGKDEKAEELREKAAAVTAAPVTVAPSVSLAGTGTTGKDDIAVEIVDPRLFLRFLLDSGVDVSTVIEFKTKGVKDCVKGLEIPEGEDVPKAP